MAMLDYTPEVESAGALHKSEIAKVLGPAQRESPIVSQLRLEPALVSRIQARRYTLAAGLPWQKRSATILREPVNNLPRPGSWHLRPISSSTSRTSCGLSMVPPRNLRLLIPQPADASWTGGTRLKSP